MLLFSQRVAYKQLAGDKFYLMILLVHKLQLDRYLSLGLKTRYLIFGPLLVCCVVLVDNRKCRRRSAHSFNNCSVKSAELDNNKHKLTKLRYPIIWDYIEVKIEVREAHGNGWWTLTNVHAWDGQGAEEGAMFRRPQVSIQQLKMIFISKVFPHT